MDSFYLKIALTIATSVVVFVYMQHLQKKKEDRADDIFNKTIDSIGKKYDKISEEKDV